MLKVKIPAARIMQGHKTYYVGRRSQVEKEWLWHFIELKVYVLKVEASQTPHYTDI